MLIPRTWMFVPGHSEKMVTKSLGLDLDVAMLDLEDGVVAEKKPEARCIVARLLGELTAPGPRRFVRMNGLSTGEADLDLHAVVVPGLEGLVVPKSETVEGVVALDVKLTKLEIERGIKPGAVRFMLAIETAKGLIAAPQLATASERVCGLMFGAEDFSRDIGLATVRTGRAREFIYARSAIVMASVAAGILPVDNVWPDLQDPEGLEVDSRLGRDLGFEGKSMIHPGQIETIARVFSPTTDEVEYSKDLIEVFEAAMKDGQGSISFGGQLVDRPIYERARATIRKAQDYGQA